MQTNYGPACARVGSAPKSLPCSRPPSRCLGRVVQNDKWLQGVVFYRICLFSRCRARLSGDDETRQTREELVSSFPHPSKGATNLRHAAAVVLMIRKCLKSFSLVLAGRLAGLRHGGRPDSRGGDHGVQGRGRAKGGEHRRVEGKRIKAPPLCTRSRGRWPCTSLDCTTARFVEACRMLLRIDAPRRPLCSRLVDGRGGV